MRWQEILEAGEAGYLYHWMTMEKSDDVLENDRMPARWEHKIDGRVVLGNSFTRNKMFSFGEEHCIRLTVDKRILSHTNKIIPLDGEFVWSRQHYPRALRHDRVAHTVGNHFGEEFVVGDIVDLSRAVVKIDVRGYNSSLFYSHVQLVKQYCMTHDLDYALSPDAAKMIKDTLERWRDDD